MKLPSDVTLITSGKPGPTVAIFAGVHGNERAGVYALEQLRNELKLTNGNAYLVLAHPPAIAANVRMLGKNLNRCFYMGNDKNSYEDIRARELMQILDTCEALLDLHMFYDDTGEPFIICEDSALEVASIFDANIISTNWSQVEPGATDDYMYAQGKIGICLECGPLSKSAEYTDFAKKSVYQFLQYFGMTPQLVAYSQTPKRVVKALQVVYKSSKNCKLVEGFRNFERLAAGQLIATEPGKQYSGREGECIIFPHYAARVGEEYYILGIEKRQITI